MIGQEVVETIVEYLTEKFGDDLISVYGIGSAFLSDLPSSDIDVIVIVSNFDNCPSYRWTPARFETVNLSEDPNDEIWLLYGTKEMYFDKETFSENSFANYEWSILDIKHGSKHLWGEDFRDELPDPEYDYDDILRRSMYHLEPLGNYKKRKMREKGEDPYDEEVMKLTKSIFKFGFFLTAYLYPDQFIFKKEDIYDKLCEEYESGNVDGRLLDFYEWAMEYRRNHNTYGFDLDDSRGRFAQIALRESLHLVGMSEERVKEILTTGFSKPFSYVIQQLDSIEWDT